MKPPKVIPSQQNPDTLTLGEYLDIAIFSFRLYFSLDFWTTLFFIITRILLDLRSLVYAFIAAKIIDTLLELIRTPGTSLSTLYPFAALLFVYYAFVEGLFSSIFSFVNRRLRALNRTELDRVFYTKIYSLGITTLEDPEINNRIQRGQQNLGNSMDFLREIVAFVARILTTIISGATVFFSFPIMIPVVIVLTIIKFIPRRKFIQEDFRWYYENTEGRRKNNHITNFLTTPALLSEIRITGAYKFLDKRFRNFNQYFNQGIFGIISRSEITYFLYGILDNAVSVIGYLLIFNNLFLGKITLGLVTFQMRALDIFASSMSDFSDSFAYLNELAIKLRDVAILFKMPSEYLGGKVKFPHLTTPPRIEFKNVYFHYPNSETNIFENLNLSIDSGEKIAIVGHNGAGKTTLIKLLAGIYQVQQGQILINGVDIKDLHLDDWHKNMGILFQDYNFYGFLSVKDNIYIGRSHKKLNIAKIKKAAQNADADEFIEKYKHGYDNIMSERFKEGTRPSMGQAQKIAIARFFYRNAPMAVFDEPTAAIDAVSEYKIFNKIYKFFKSKTVVIISHRFSTVRNADRIIVMDHGQIVEEGTHETLMRHNSVYAHAFRLQAEGYQK